jgi:uncharacterized membrane protein YoaK (UPF0700 family)
MADIENGIHDALVATAEPDEEANRRCRQQILGVLSLVLGAITAVLLLMCIYYGLKDDSSIPLWALALILGMQAFLVGFGFFRARRPLWKILCEICNPEEEWQIDA